MSVELVDDNGPLTTASRVYGRISPAGQPKSFSPNLIWDFVRTAADVRYALDADLSSLSDYVDSFTLQKSASDNTKWDGQSLVARAFADAVNDDDLATLGQVRNFAGAAGVDIVTLSPLSGPVDNSSDYLILYDASSAANVKITPGDLVPTLDADLTAIGALSGTGMLGRTASNTWALRSFANAAAGLTWTNADGVSGNPTPVFANDLGALEALSSTGLAVRTASDTWAQRTLTGTSNEVAVSNGDGVSGNPTISLPSAITLTGKTLTGGTFASPTAITGLPDPTGAQDAATKNYVDLVAQGLDAKPSVRAATTANITLSGAQTIDGVSVIAGDRVLVKNQSTTANNGIYVCASGSWTRATDMDAWSELPGAYCWVEEGTTNGDTGWTCTSNAGGSLGSTAVTWTQFAGAGSYTAGTGLSLSGTQFSIDSTVATLSGSQALTNKSYNGLTLTATTGTFTLTNGKTFSVSNTVTLTATDGATLAIGGGGTLGTAAYQSTGTSGANIPFLNGANTWSALQTFSNGISLASGQTINWNSDLYLTRDAANVFVQRNSTNAQSFFVYNTYTDATTGEWAGLQWSSNVLRLVVDKNGSGTYRSFALRLSNFSAFTVDSSVMAMGVHLNGASAVCYGFASINIGTASAASGTFLQIAAATTTKSHINLASGVAPTSPNNGDVWFDGTDVKIRIGGATKTFTVS